MEIDCGVCLLRRWKAGDEASLRRNADDREVWLNLRDRFPHPYTDADAREWIEIASKAEQPTSFAIDVGGDAVGSVSVRLNEDVERVSAEIGYWLGHDYWGRGIMSAAVRAVTDYAFSAFDLTRVYAVPFARNPASARVLENAGFVYEGILRRSAIKDGVVLDEFLFAMTDRDRAEGSDEREERLRVPVVTEQSLRVAEAVRAACLRTLESRYEDAGLQGLCDEGRWEAAVGGLRFLELRRLLEDGDSASGDR